MKLVVPQETLSKALSNVSRIANSRGSLPILNNILIRAENNQLQLISTNLEIFISETLTAKIDRDGTVCVPASTLNDYIHTLPKTNISLTAEGNLLEITAGDYNSRINVVQTDDFPSVPSLESADKINLETNLLKTAVSQVVGVASNDTTRPILTGIYLYSANKKIFLVATDGYRLAEKKLCEHNGKALSVIIPASTLSEICRIIEDDGKVEVNISDEQISFTYKKVVLNSRVIDGNYIKYQSLIPTKTANKAILNKSDFVQAMKSVDIFARESAGTIKIKLDEKNQKLQIDSLQSEIGVNDVAIDAEVIGDETVNLNSKYLLAALGQVDGDTVSFGFSDKVTPILVTGNQKDYKHIIMPIKS